jgi:hypothetical protein
MRRKVYNRRLFWEIQYDVILDRYIGFLKFYAGIGSPCLCRTKPWPSADFVVAELMGLAEQRQAQLSSTGHLYDSVAWQRLSPDRLQEA